MAVYTRRTRVEAPLEAVWAFHSTPDGLAALTPGFVNLTVERVEGPDGEPDPEVLEAGSRVHVSVQPFGVGPRRTWVSHIVERERTTEEAHFRDTMEEGPFRRWEHTHRFLAAGDATVVVDRVAYELPGGPAGRVLAQLAKLGMAPTFRYRHRRTRELLE